MIYHYFGGGSSGVSRFDLELRRVFPGMKSVTALPGLDASDVVITDNHLSLDVPIGIRTIVVHHGCAPVHYARDKAWRSIATHSMMAKQLEMLNRPNREGVAPSQWVADQFSLAYGGNYHPRVIPHWVSQIDPLPKSGKPKVIGDWRDNNKGLNVWQKLAECNPQWEFQPLNFRDDAGKRKQYGEASLYLCLSLSEGGSYSMCDAEAAELPIVTTNVGNYLEFDDCHIIQWQDRDNIDLVSAAIASKLAEGRRGPSFYASYSFRRWERLWREILG
jgi:glycosyltransferase involved in cell wall biosynthesis